MRTQLTFLALIVSSLIFYACDNNKCIQAEGDIKQEQRNIEDFSKLELSGAFKVLISQDSFSIMKINAPENVISQVKSRVSGKTLKIEMENNVCDDGIIEITLSSKIWESIRSSGASEIYSTNLINAENLDVSLSGASKVNLNLAASRLKTRASGSSEINYSGQCGEHIVDVSGSNQINAFDFIVSDYKIETSGASKININVLKLLDVKSSGASEILYKGSPKNISNNQDGSSSLQPAP